MKWICLLLFMPIMSIAQKSKDTIIKYLDQNLQFTTAKNGTFIGVAIKVESGWYVHALYPDTTPLLKAYYKDKDLKIKEGPYALYHPKNQKAMEGHYHNNQMVGTWRFWHQNGQLKDSGQMANNLQKGNWRSWYANGFPMSDCSFDGEPAGDVNAILQIAAKHNLVPSIKSKRTGAYTSWYSNGNMEAIGHFENDLMQGEWKWYHDNGRPSTAETYAKGQITNLQCYDTSGKLMDEICSIEKPALLKKYGDFKAYIFENLTWPTEAVKRNIEGLVKVRFTIDKRGILQNLTITTPEPLLRKAVEDLFVNMQEWYPAISHNRVIDWEGSIDIPFYHR